LKISILIDKTAGRVGKNDGTSLTFFVEKKWEKRRNLPAHLFPVDGSQEEEASVGKDDPVRRRVCWGSSYWSAILNLSIYMYIL